MAGKRREFTAEQQAELREAIRNSQNKMDHRRLLILQAVAASKSTLEAIASEFKVSKSMVSHLVSSYQAKGIAEVLTKLVGGNRQLLSTQEEAELLQEFRSRAEKGEMLEVAAIHAAYEQRVGRAVVKSIVYRMLHRHQWRKVMPRSKHPKKANPEEIVAYKKNHR